MGMLFRVLGKKGEAGEIKLKGYYGRGEKVRDER